METRANYLLIGAFSLLGFLGILGFFLWFANLELNRQFAYYDIYFAEVSGLSVSSDVRFAGLPVGRVVEMQIAEQGDDAVRVRVELTEGTPVRADSTAGLSPQGVTGVMAVSITSGSSEAPLLREARGQAVPAIPSTRSALQTLSDEGPQIIERLSEVAEELANLLGLENQARVANILGNVERSTGSLDQAVSDISAATGAIAATAGNIAGFGERIGALGDAATATLSNVDTALARFAESAARADVLMGSGVAALDEIRDFAAGDLRSLSRQVESTAAAAEASLAGLDETMVAFRPALDSAGRAFGSAARVMDTQIEPIATDLRRTLTTLDGAITSVVDDLPRITGGFREAAEAASRASGNLDATVNALRAPTLAFANEGLPEFTRVATDLRDLIGNVDSFVASLRRNPSQILSGERAPEFRR